MEIKIDRSFQKDTKRIKDKTVLQKVANTIANVQRARNLDEIKNLQKIKGTTSMYRIRISDYRIGLLVSESSVEFIRFLHRKDIYKYFP
ncbi:MAG: plasmid stabilization protein [Bacteroides sp. SM1_62]|nr:MAG: plasmid stabilization protein [Bacteroides sp. SM1_62]